MFQIPYVLSWGEGVVGSFRSTFSPLMIITEHSARHSPHLTLNRKRERGGKREIKRERGKRERERGEEREREGGGREREGERERERGRER